MAEIKLYNVATRLKEPLEPLDPENLQMYVCGPTVYDRAHLGNARPVVVFDTLYRLLRHSYGAEHVTYVRNFTDVDDRINDTAQRRKAAGAAGTLEELIRERSDETIGWYHDDMAALGALRPDHEPRATAHIAGMIAMIEDLIAKGHAYAAEGHVLFAVDSYPDYGKLSGRSTDDMIAGARVEVAPYKKNPMDFVLWKPSTDELPGWDSPWGRGRPGWHIECSAMSKALFGESFDIHGGGIDLAFPHHENEIAQSKCAHPGDDFARIWMHNEMLQVEGKKMSKSLGNFFTVRDLLDQGVPGEVIRFVFLSTHYRKPMDWTEKRREEAAKKLAAWFKKTDGVEAAKVVAVSGDRGPLQMNLNTSLALTEMNSLSAPYLKAAMRLVGFPDAEEVEWFRGSAVAGGDMSPEDSARIDALVARRAQAKKDLDFAQADQIRDVLAKAGVVITDTANGSRWEQAGALRLEEFGGAAMTGSTDAMKAARCALGLACRLPGDVSPRPRSHARGCCP